MANMVATACMAAKHHPIPSLGIRNHVTTNSGNHCDTYYQRFMSRFPNLISLANASEDVVIEHWAIGYYRRAFPIYAVR